MDQDVKGKMVVWKEEVKKDHQEQGRLPRNITMLTPEADLECPECGARMRRQHSQRMRRFFYRCEREDCDGYLGAHPDGSPLGIPANKQIRQKRTEAHGVFDLLWQEGYVKRTTAYRIMAERMGIDGELHIANLGWDECERLIELASEYLDELRNEPLEDRSEPDEEEDGWIVVKQSR